MTTGMKIVEHHKFVYESHLRRCNVCKVIKVRRFTGKDRRNRVVWRDEKTNNRWDGSTCPKCFEIDRTRRKGGLPIDEVRNCTSAEGRRCEIKAANFFRRMGFSVKLNNVQGPDLTLVRSRTKITCEVKKVTQGKWLNHEKWAVSAVRGKRMKDDLICFVYTDGFYVTTMKKHLPLCDRSGRRAIKVSERYKLIGVDPDVRLTAN